MKFCLLTAIGLCLSGAAMGQTPFWTEDFGSGCNSGQLVTAYSGPNGAWTVTNTGTNASGANVWYVSAKENGNAAGQCGSGCGTDRTLHVGNVQILFIQPDGGAAYYDGGIGCGGFLPCASTSRRVESPVINCSAYTSPSVTFLYLEGGNAIDNATLWYYDGTSWSQLQDLPKTPLACSPQGQWTSLTVSLPASASNNPSMRIGFQWINNDDGVATDPSFAVDDIVVSGTLAGGDTTPPVVTCPAAQSVSAGLSCTALVPDLVALTTVADNQDPSPSLTQSPAAGTAFSGSQVVTLTATDDAGNSAGCTVTVTAIDASPPLVNCLNATIQVPADAACQAAIPAHSGNVGISDNCTSAGSLSVTQAPPQGTLISVPTLVTVTATDAAGNSASCSYTVIPADQTPPSVNCVSPTVDVPAGTGCQAVVPSHAGQVSFSDNCTSPGALAVVQTPAPGTAFTASQLVTVTVSDESGNSASCSYTLVAVDETPPTVACSSAGITEPLGPSCEAVLGDYASGFLVADNCSSSGSITVTQLPVPGTLFNSPLPVTVTVTDESGNSSTCSFEVEPVDETPLALQCPPAVEVVVAGLQTEGYAEVPAPAVSDNCLAEVVVTNSFNGGENASGAYPVGETVVVYTAQNADGETATCTTQVTVTVGGCCPPDLNCDGYIGVTDLLIFNANFGCLTGCPGDINGDGLVTVTDLLLFTPFFGTNCP